MSASYNLDTALVRSFDQSSAHPYRLSWGVPSVVNYAGASGMGFTKVRCSLSTLALSMGL